MGDAGRESLPAKLYFRIGEVAELVGVEPRAAGDLDPREAAKLREQLRTMRGEIEAFLAELEPSPH